MPERRCLYPWLMGLVAAFCLLGAADARAQGLDPAGRPIGEVVVEGLEQVSRQLVDNHIRAEVGDPYDESVVESDIVRLTRLDQFSRVEAQVEPMEDGQLRLIYAVQEQPLLSDVQVVGNRAFTDRRLLEEIRLRSGDAADSFFIDRGRRRIVDHYADHGYFMAEVEVDEELLEEEGVLLYRVREGPRVRIRRILFEGNEVFDDRELRTEVRSDTFIPVFRRGQLSREQLELDAAAVRDYYRQRGHLDAQVGRRIDLGPDQRDAVVTFTIEEGERYFVDRVRFEGIGLFAEEQLRRAIELREGGVFSEEGAEATRRIVRDLYGELGYLETRVEVGRLFHEDQPRVDLRISVEEGLPAHVGTVSIRGNQATRDRVILRELRGLSPGRPFQQPGIQQTRRRLAESPLFSDATITVLGEPGDETRDVLIEVDEQQTGSINIGAGVSSDLGVMGAFQIQQRNFDIAAPPRDLEELVTGQAFRGAGQFFQLTLQPGTRASRYAINFREPALLESPYFLDAGLNFSTRQFRRFDERRFGGNLGLGQQFGDVWSASVRARAQEIRISNIDNDAPLDIFAVRGTNVLTALGFELVRDDTDSGFFPTEGSRWTGEVERVGALGGDFDFTRVRTRYRHFWTVDEDFLGRRSVLSFRGELGYIFERDEAPLFERFFAGGHRTFRGFEDRGVGPRGITPAGDESREASGGRWLALSGLEYNFPIAGEPGPGPGQHMGTLHGVAFADMGTVRRRTGFDDWRVSVGGGIRFKIPFLGDAPFAIDLAVPVRRESEDRTQIISFDLALPLQ